MYKDDFLENQEPKTNSHWLKNSLSTNLGLIIAMGASYALAPIYPIFLWIAPFFSITLILNNRRIYNLLTTALLSFVGSFFQIFYIYYGTCFPIQRVILPLLIDALFLTIFLWLTSITLTRVKSWITIFVLPTLITTYLHIILLINHGDVTVVSTLPEQIHFLPIIQIVSITGPLGLSFLMIFVPAGFAIGWYFRKTDRPLAIRALIATLLLFGAIWSFGFLRLRTQNPSPTIRVGLAANSPLNLKAFLQTRNTNNIDATNSFIKTVENLAQRGARYILQPENALCISPENDVTVLKMLANAALTNQVYIFAPIAFINRTKERNSLLVFNPEGKLILSYDKMHLVAGFEDHMQPGTKTETFQIPTGLIGATICHDIDFLQTINDHSKLGTGIIFVPAADFGDKGNNVCIKGDGAWHAQLAILQAVSGGFSLARVAFSGFISATDPVGNILEWKEVQAGKEIFSIIDIPVGSGKTVYTQTGNWFAWLNCMDTIIILISLLL